MSSAADFPAVATLRTIARETGYALATVSYALRDHAKVSAETRQKIQAVAQRLGYRPNPLVTSVMAQVRAANPPRYGGTLVCLSRWKDAAPELDPDACTRFLQGARDRAAAFGWRFEDFPCHPGLSGARLTQILKSRGIQGVLIGPLPWDARGLELDWASFACVTWGYSLRFPALHRVVSHHGQAVALAIEHARRRGVRRVGIAVPAHLNTRTEHLYEGAFHVHQRDLPVRRRVAPFLPVGADWNAAALGRWLEREQPDAILATKDILPLLSRLRARSRPLEILALDHSSFPPDSRLAGVDFSHRAVGMAAIDLLMTQINANERGLPLFPKRVMIEGRWTEANQAV